MKIDLKIRWRRNVSSKIGTFNIGDIYSIPVDLDYIENHNDLLDIIEEEVGWFDEVLDFVILNEERLWSIVYMY